MKTTLSLQRVALLALALGTATVTASFAQTTTTPSTTTCPAGGKHHHGLGSVLTPDEKTQLKTAHEAALAADPSLKTDGENLKQQFETLKSEGKGTATKDQWQALRQQARSYHDKLKAAELAIDPTLAPIFAKLEAAPHKHWHHSSTSSST